MATVNVQIIHLYDLSFLKNPSSLKKTVLLRRKAVGFNKKTHTVLFQMLMFIGLMTFDLVKNNDNTNNKMISIDDQIMIQHPSF